MAFRAEGRSASAAWHACWPTTACQKKLHRCRPRLVPEPVEARISQKVVRHADSDPLGIERGVRQRLADKISDNLAGLWLLVPEHLRLGTWDLLRAWTRQTPQRREPRWALQWVHEAALCTHGNTRSLLARVSVTTRPRMKPFSQKGCAFTPSSHGAAPNLP